VLSAAGSGSEARTACWQLNRQALGSALCPRRGCGEQAQSAERSPETQLHRGHGPEQGRAIAGKRQLTATSRRKDITPWRATKAESGSSRRRGSIGGCEHPGCKAPWGRPSHWRGLSCTRAHACAAEQQATAIALLPMLRPRCPGSSRYGVVVDDHHAAARTSRSAATTVCVGRGFQPGGA